MGKRFDEAANKEAQIEARAFKNALQSAADNDSKKTPPGIMARFLNYPEKFLFGASSSSYQYEGGLDTKNKNGKYTNANAQFYHENTLPLAGKAIDFWNRYASDIKDMKQELGINSFRISIAWDRICPAMGEYDTLALTQYATIMRVLKKYTIEPIVVLHHYTIPTWFQDIGGFEKIENIHHFVEYAKKVYEYLHKDVTYWSTFNAIEGYAFKGYQQGDGPPGIKNNMYLTQKVMAHMLEAHVQIYQAIKGKTNGMYTLYKTVNPSIPLPQIGLQKNVVMLDPYHNVYFPTKVASGITSVIGEGAQNKGFFDFFKSGQFRIFTPKPVTLYNKLAPQSIDWIGLNVYSNMHMLRTKPQKETDPNYMTTNLNYRNYPAGIYRGIKLIYDRLAKHNNIPIIITENGIATDDDKVRKQFFRRILYIIRKLIEKGYPIIGYTPWASHDNYEWPTKEQPEALTSRRYGFFFVDFTDSGLPRRLKRGAHYYRDFIEEFFKKSIIFNIDSTKE